MPEVRLAKARATLPEFYQFGDAAGDPQWRSWLRDPNGWAVASERIRRDMVEVRIPAVWRQSIDDID